MELPFVKQSGRNEIKLIACTHLNHLEPTSISDSLAGLSRTFSIKVRSCSLAVPTTKEPKATLSEGLRGTYSGDMENPVLTYG